MGNVIIQKFEKVEGGIQVSIGVHPQVLQYMLNGVNVQALCESNTVITIPDGAVEVGFWEPDHDEDDAFFGLEGMIVDLSLDLLADVQESPEEFIVLSSYQQLNRIIYGHPACFHHETDPESRAIGVLGYIHGQTVIINPLGDFSADAEPDLEDESPEKNQQDTAPVQSTPAPAPKAVAATNPNPAPKPQVAPTKLSNLTVMRMSKTIH